MKDFVIGIGRTNIDLIYSGLDRLPALGEEVFSQGFEMHLGGGVPGEAVILSKLGIPVKAMTWLGQNVFSGIAEQEFRIGDPDVIDLYHGTGFPVILTSAMLCGDDRTFLSYRADLEITAADMERIRLEHQDAKIVLLSSHYPDVYRSLDLSGAVKIFDTGWEDDLSLQEPRYRSLIELADHYLPNRKEALKITGAATVEQAAEILSEFFPQVIIKLDREGCLIRDEQGIRIIPAMPGITAVDSTGAGDAFLCGFVYGIYHGYGIDDCVRFGNITGGTCVQAVGCLTKTLTEKELLETLRKVYG